MENSSFYNSINEHTALDSLKLKGYFKLVYII